MTAEPHAADAPRPSRARRWWRGLCIVSLLLALLAMVTSGSTVLIAVIFGVPLAFATLVVALAGEVRQLALPKNARTRERGGLITLLTSLLLVLGFVVAAAFALDNAMRTAQGALIADHLKATAGALEAYVAAHGDYPPTLGELAAAPATRPTSTPATVRVEQIGLGGVAVAYRPGTGAWRHSDELILIQELRPRTPLKVRIFSERGVHVLYGDGTVRVLGRDALHAALVQDRARREALGWPLKATVTTLEDFALPPTTSASH